MSAGGRELTDEQRTWLRVRAHLVRERHPLAVRAYGDRAGPVDAPLLIRPEWLPERPVPLGDVRLEHRPGAPFAGVTGRGAGPVRPDGSRYERYSEVLTNLAPPGVLRDLPTYRLLSADLRDEARLVLGDGSYFDGLDTGEAAAHDYAAADLGGPPGELRAAIGDPTDLTRRPVNLAVSALTLRVDGGTATMPLHRRDPAKVGHAGGMIQVLPVGVFQPVGPEPWNKGPDLSLWRLLLREYAEELLGAPEDYDTTTGPYDYDGWPFGRRMTAARSEGRIRPYVLGLGVDPLTYATDLLVAVVFEAATYDELFAAAVAGNAEGDVLPAVPFTAAQVEKYATREPTQAAGAALLRLAHQHRATLLS